MLTLIVDASGEHGSTDTDDSDGDYDVLVEPMKAGALASRDIVLLSCEMTQGATPLGTPRPDGIYFTEYWIARDELASDTALCDATNNLSEYDYCCPVCVH